eukprot:CAMPEP_0114352696 /NCGR_PEP_ID=MMETSP0101-20121206/18129_1 /TAXON_ID=38822 ORGANISM="Pteridomonas danica, Strain PT" /NCGR_SAMPLE_ID=MMETSP0101 /ASSEMBLY_ACC=CAM_ASM_000211 /LENGTH=208 /DNA_ID=CAMNT_0001493205 /DNA_START=26 /DNA_END=652 /DNA_ORIENTATION=+
MRRIQLFVLFGILCFIEGNSSGVQTKRKLKTNKDGSRAADEELKEVISESLGTTFCATTTSMKAIIERHDEDEDAHGDVCRYQSGAHGFFCPQAPPLRGRKQISCYSTTKPPYCVMSSTDYKKLPCRVPQPEEDIWDEAAILLEDDPKLSPLHALRLARSQRVSVLKKNIELKNNMTANLEKAIELEEEEDKEEAKEKSVSLPPLPQL